MRDATPPLQNGFRRARLLCRLARQIASAFFDVPLVEIERPNRAAAASCEARHAAMYLANVVFQIPLVVIAQEFGRDRTSVGHAIRRVEDRRDDPPFDHCLERLEALAASCLTLLDETKPE
ncbi:hypothetical protein GCM10011390_10850 [Aureimonas endophytica]|uniref:Chromosomal replication initiator DnaA C-terminal domain-containing protein n=1 Tax=Aureimonas endophytica TaxID=2027858 RepID=A0A917E1V5_9HYPH|nr:helix-turn-helix domain-containing protein [Aureimonas endophytica]GGD93961.1 hypothetical protein GCM10011390_10850 [Aureimonas endophytica]